VQRGFTGLELRHDRLVLNPKWPESLGELAFPLQYRRHRLHVRIRGGGAEISADSGDAAPVLIEVNRRTQLLAAGTTARFD
jgi:trehalose/maltose hydrolase-like predicted phosphorylase